LESLDFCWANHLDEELRKHPLEPPHLGVKIDENWML
jgi:hypothetical protein